MQMQEKRRPERWRITLPGDQVVEVTGRKVVVSDSGTLIVSPTMASQAGCSATGSVARQSTAVRHERHGTAPDSRRSGRLGRRPAEPQGVPFVAVRLARLSLLIDAVVDQLYGHDVHDVDALILESPTAHLSLALERLHWLMDEGSNASGGHKADRQTYRSAGGMRACDVAPRQTQWLWSPYFPFGKISVVAGQMGQAKSLFTTWLASFTTPGGVIMLSAEDDPADTIRPRLEAVEADLSRVEIAADVTLDAGRLGAMCDEVGDVRLITIDPIQAYLPSTVNSWKGQDVRLALEPVRQLAAERMLAVC